jgi:hypothetical membrane protein
MHTDHPRPSRLFLSWIAAGFLSFLPHLIAIIVATAMRPDFNHKRQFLSELGDRASPTAALFNFFGVMPTGALILVFGVGLALAYRAEPLLRIAGALVAVHGLCRIGAAMFPCDAGCRPLSPSYSQVIHNATATTAFLALTVALFIAGAWLIKRRRPFAIIVPTYLLGIVAVAAQALLTLGSAASTGLFQRLALGALQLWLVLFSAHIYAQAKAANKRNTGVQPTPRSGRG